MPHVVPFLSRHHLPVMLFSAGKDSAAMLKLLWDYRSQFLVLWVNQGNPHPETVEYMEKVRKSVPHFLMLEGRQKEFVKKYGHPVDVLPVTVPGVQSEFSSFVACCGANSWQPYMAFVRENNITGVIRGQKAVDFHQASVRSGAVVEGVEYFHPLENWTDEEVYTFLGDDLPASYKRGGKSSLDCMNCTAYVAQSRPNYKNLPLEVQEEISIVHSRLREKLKENLELLNG